MGRPTNAERAARDTANADATNIEADDGLEAFERPVQAVKADDPAPQWRSKVRVLPKGHGRIATGHYDRAENAFSYHAKGDYLFLPPAIAKEQEDNGFVEIVTDGA